MSQAALLEAITEEKPPIPKAPHNLPINGLIYDAEIENCICGNKEIKDSRYKYCSGWDDFKGMGIAVICVFDLVTKEPRIFGKGNFGDFQKLAMAREEIIGFNSKRFDDKLLAAHGMANIRTTYDILEELRTVTGEANDKRKRGGMGLGKLAEDNDIGRKLLNGADAPKLWQIGSQCQVIDYCLSDVMLTYKIFRRRHAIWVKSWKRYFSLPEPLSIREQARKLQKDDW